MTSDANVIVGWFQREGFPQGTLDFDQLLYQAVRDALGKSEIDTEAYLQRNSMRLWNELLKSLDNDGKLGRGALFDIRDTIGRKLAWRPSNLSLARTNGEKKLWARLGARPAILKAIDALSAREYEALGCVICALIGANNTFLTPHGNERGIDFLATINVPGRSHVISGAHKLFRVVGQAKKYETKVELGEVQRLNDTLDEIRYQASDVQRLLPAWFQAASGPIVGWLISHRGVQAGGLSYAKNHGIITSDSVDLAEIAALSRQIDDVSSPSQRAKILVANVHACLAP